jgi:hypothetical protein
MASGKCPLGLWVSLGSLERPKDTKDAKTLGLWRARYLVSWRHGGSFEEAICLPRSCRGLCEECLYSNVQVFRILLISSGSLYFVLYIVICINTIVNRLLNF